MRYLFTGLLIVVALSCNTAKKDFNNVNKAILRNPYQTSKQLADKWPCIPLVVGKDSTDYKKYLEDLTNMTAFYEAELQHREVERITDTFSEIWADTTKIKWYARELSRKKLNEKYLNSYIDSLTEICAQNPGIHDTIKINDLTIVEKLKECDNSNSNLQIRIDKKDQFNIWLLIISFVLLILHVLRSKFRL